ncbi:MAG: S8 family serine peptidase [Chloroflexi bacterium]|nr:S8 family serine peptidase [Chloroflexota bacterium]
MVKQEQVSGHWFNQRLVLFVLIIAAALFIHGTAVTASSSLPIHGSVAMWAEEHPGEPVPLIVQHDGTPDDLLAFVRESGGVVEREFHIVPAIDIEVPANVVNGLAGQGDVEWISLDAPVTSTAVSGSPDPNALATAYPFAVGATDAWFAGFTGAGVTVALVDTGVSQDAQQDFTGAGGGRRVQWVTVSDLDKNQDGFGHGTHVGGIIAGRSTTNELADKYTGIAPAANILSVRIADDEGNATVGDLMAGLEWVDDNRDDYNIRVLNLSVSSSIAQSYTVDPIDAAVELLWFHGIVVVVAAGNEGDASDAVSYPPANDPFVITVGAFDDQGTASLKDDRLASWSSRGTTQDGFAKPELLAPGANIVAPVSDESYLAETYPQAIVQTKGDVAYFQMSGTSMSTGVVSGAAALMLEAHPEWTPGEVKDVLLETARSVKGKGGAVRVDDAVAFSEVPESTDDELTPNYILLAALLADAVATGDVELGLDGIRWRDADGIWHETSFEGIRWRDVDFDGIRWRGLDFDGIRWRDVDWSGIRWRGLDFEGIRWRGLDFDGIRWRGIRWRSFVEN